MGRKAESRPLTEEERRLAEEHLDFARRAAASLARRYRGLPIDWESECYLETCRAARRYDSSRGVDFKTYIYRRLSGLAIDLVRDSNPKGWRRGEAGYRTPHPAIGPLGPETPDVGHPVGRLVESIDAVEWLTRRLPGPDRGVVRALCTRGCTQEALARELGVCRSYVNQLWKRGIGKLREVHDAGG